MSTDSMVSVCSSGGSQQSAAGDVSSDKKKKPKVWVMSHGRFILCYGFIMLMYNSVCSFVAAPQQRL